MYFTIKGKGTYENDYARPERERKNAEAERLRTTLPLEANPSYKEFDKASYAFSKMDKVKDRKDREQLEAHIRSMTNLNKPERIKVDRLYDEEE